MCAYLHRNVGKKSRAIIERDANVSSPSLTREYDFVYGTGNGANIWDADGKKYLDFASSVAVMNIGYGNRDVKTAIMRQLEQGTHAGFADFYAETPVRFEETLLSHAPREYNRVFLSNSGTEAVESALKCAKWHSRKKWMIAFKPCFHGRTMGSLSMTHSNPLHRAHYAPFLPVKHVPYPYLYRSPYESEVQLADACLSDVEAAIKRVRGNVAGLFFEPVSGEGGYVVPPKAFVKGLRKVCTQHGVLLCTDEVQAGAYRTGTFLSLEQFGVTSDIACMAKGIGGGLPIGATMANKKTMDWEPGTHASTFGGNLVSCAAGIAALKYMEKNRLGEKAQKTGSVMVQRLRELQENSRIIGDVRGLGLMIGVELVQDKKTKRFGVAERQKTIRGALDRGLILLPAGKSTIRIAPPLVISREQALAGLDVFESAIREAEKK